MYVQCWRTDRRTKPLPWQVHLHHFRRSQLHWLDVVDRVRFRVCVQVFRWLHKMAPEYLSIPTANPSPASLAVATCDRLTVAISTSHVWNLLRTEDVHLHTPALPIGTHFLLTLKTVVFLFHLLSTISKPFSSLSTRLAHAARLVFFYKKTRYINSLLLIACGLIGPEWAKNVALICSECDRSYFSAQFSTDCATRNMFVHF